ncbi:hypothetical protein BD309DRAFT_70361 [Dichomitus squalens]|nr:hypothetical protein BD309DRAFT_70361 [Dichomitus squalens]
MCDLHLRIALVNMYAVFASSLLSMARGTVAARYWLRQSLLCGTHYLQRGSMCVRKNIILMVMNKTERSLCLTQFRKWGGQNHR